jgi:hypothetical protein
MSYTWGESRVSTVESDEPSRARRLELLSVATEYATSGKPADLASLAQQLATSQERMYFVRCFLLARRAYRATMAARATERLQRWSQGDKS